MVGLDVFEDLTGQPGDPPRAVAIRELLLAVPATFKGHAVAEWEYGSGFVLPQTSHFVRGEPGAVPGRMF